MWASVQRVAHGAEERSLQVRSGVQKRRACLSICSCRGRGVGILTAKGAPDGSQLWNRERKAGAVAKKGSKGQEQPRQKTAERRGRDGNEELGSSTGNGIDQLISEC